MSAQKRQGQEKLRFSSHTAMLPVHPFAEQFEELEQKARNDNALRIWYRDMPEWIRSLQQSSSDELQREEEEEQHPGYIKRKLNDRKRSYSWWKKARYVYICCRCYYNYASIKTFKRHHCDPLSMKARKRFVAYVQNRYEEDKRKRCGDHFTDRDFSEWLTTYRDIKREWGDITVLKMEEDYQECVDIMGD